MPPPIRVSGWRLEWTQHRRPAASVLPVNQQRLPMQPNVENRFDTHPLSKSVHPCLAGCPPAENTPEKYLAAPNAMDPGLAG